MKQHVVAFLMVAALVPAAPSRADYLGNRLLDDCVVISDTDATGYSADAAAGMSCMGYLNGIVA